MKIKDTCRFSGNSVGDLGMIAAVIETLLTRANSIPDGSITKEFQINFLSKERNDEMISISGLLKEIKELFSAESRKLIDQLRINLQVNLEIDRNFDNHKSVDLTGFVLNWTHQGSKYEPDREEFSTKSENDA